MRKRFNAVQVRATRAAAALAAAVILTPAASAAQSGAIPAYVTAAVNDASRSDAERQRDAARKPGEVLAFAGVKPGDRVGELIPARGYYTNIFCKLVGPNGHVYTMNAMPTARPPGPPPGAGGPDGPPRPPAGPAPGAACDNVTPDSATAAAFHLPDNLDLVWTSENYHDLHNPMFGVADMQAFNAVVFKALKPGGIYMVEDHAAEKGSGARDTSTLHRIDEELVKKEVTGAGFKFVGESAVLHTDEPHTARVYELQGKSDKFLLKFQKPKG